MSAALGGGLLVWALLAPAVTPAAAQCRYEVTRIRQCPFATSGNAINNHGAIAGHYLACPDGLFDEAFSWDPTGSLVTLPRMGNFEARAFDINDRGQVVGQAGAARTTPVLWEDGEFIDLGLLPGANTGSAIAINSCGQIVGYSTNNGTGRPWDAVLWTDGQMVSLRPLLGEPITSFAWDINNRSQIVGRRQLEPGFDRRAFLLDGETLIDLHAGFGFQWSEARAINDHGIVVGHRMVFRTPVDFYRQPVMWVDGVPRDLHVPPGEQGAMAVDINNAGEIIAGPFGAGDGYYLVRRGETLDLNELLLDEEGRITGLGGINDSGQITGKVDSDAVVLTPRSDPPGDLTCDGVIDVTDLVRMLRAWGHCGLCPADLNGDGWVELADLEELVSNWT